MSIALDSNGKIPYIFESGIKNPSSRKASAANILAGSPVTLSAAGEYIVAGTMVGAGEVLANIDGILLNDIVFEAAAFKSNVSQGVTSITSLGHNQYSGTQAPASGSFSTTKHNGSLNSGESVVWDGTQYIQAGLGDDCVGEAANTAASGEFLRVILRPHVA